MLDAALVFYFFHPRPFVTQLFGGLHWSFLDFRLNRVLCALVGIEVHPVWVQMEATVSCTEVTNSEAAGSEMLTTAEQLPGKRVILLVEDEPLVRRVTCEVLQSAGYRVLKAKNSAEAVRMFLQHEEEIDLLLTDEVLPGRSGHELARDLRAIGADIQIIFTSGYPASSVQGDSHHEVGVFYLPKPYAVQSLIAKVRQALEQKCQPASAAAVG